MKKKKTFNRVYIVVFAVLFSVAAVSFSFVSAQNSNNDDMLDQIMLSFLQLKSDGVINDISDGEEDLGRGDRTDTVIVSKKIDYDDITTTGVDITNTVIGDFYVEDVIIETNRYRIASGTNFQIVTSGDTYGTTTPVFKMGISKMDEASTWSLDSPISDGEGTEASSTQRIILEDGAKLVAQCTTADCMLTTDPTDVAYAASGGYMRIHVLLKRVDNISQIYD